MKKLSFVLFLVACAFVIAWSREDTYKRESYKKAWECADHAPTHMSYDDVRVNYTDGRSLYIYEKMGIYQIRDNVNDLPDHLTEDEVVVAAAFYNPQDSTIYIPRRFRERQDVLMHEYIHAFGIMGHDWHFFETCGISDKQMNLQP